MNYEVLRIIWWALLGILLAGFAIMDGFDLGVAALLPFAGRNDLERRVVINTVGPVWEGNQVWIILGGGAIFAAWPILYAVAFSGFYLAMLLVLLTVGIIRPVAFKYRSKLTSKKWRNLWDGLLSFSGFVAPLLFGVAIGNVLLGVPFNFNDNLRAFYTGSFWGLLNPFAILCGLVSMTMLIMHGGLYLATKTEKVICQRAVRYSRIATVLFILLFSLAGFSIAHWVKGYIITQSFGPIAPSNPLHKTVITQIGGWLVNYSKYSWMLLAPILAYAGAILSFLLSYGKKHKVAFVSSSISILGTIATVGFSMFPILLPSSSNPNMSLSAWDASSSETTLMIMLVATIIFMPLILLYTAWVYRVLRGKVTEDYITSNKQSTY